MRDHLRKAVLNAQRDEATDSYIYSELAKRSHNQKTKKILYHVSGDEQRHYTYLKKITKTDVSPNLFKAKLYILVGIIFGAAFTVRLMERAEGAALKTYKKLKPHYPGVQKIIDDEEQHEKHMFTLLSQETVTYAGSFVLGLNDALVELSGALAGLTLALQNTKLIAVIGVITGIAASLSMAASEYLSKKEEEEKTPLRSATYTGIAYILTVTFLISPYFIFTNAYLALLTMFGAFILIVSAYCFFISILKEIKFWKKFMEMALISLSVSVISFGVGYLIRGYA